MRSRHAPTSDWTTAAALPDIPATDRKMEGVIPMAGHVADHGAFPTGGPAGGPTSCIRQAEWLIAWDPARNDFNYLRGADMVFRGNTILHVGGHFSGPVDHEIDGRQRLVVPGLINTHYHSTVTMIRKGITQDSCNYLLPAFYQNVNILQPPQPARAAATAFGIGQLLRGGTTTLMDWVAPYEGWLDTLASTGARVYAAPFFTSAEWSVGEHRQLRYHWRSDKGHALFDLAQAVMDAAEAHPSGRLAAMVAPSELEATTPDLLRQGRDLARRTGRPFQVHAAESAREFAEFMTRHGMSPIQWAAQLGLLGENSAIGHGLYLDHHSGLRAPAHRDLALLAESGTTVTHCPTSFAAQGEGMESLSDYLSSGVNVTLGNDTFPHGMLQEMKIAVLVSRLKSRHDFGRATHPSGQSYSLGAGEILKSATAGAADYLGRPDLGRLAPGCKADFFTVDLTHPDMMPVHDPLRSLIYCAGDRAVRDVYVDGAQVVAEGRLLTLDLGELAATLAMAQGAMRDAVATRPDAAGCAADQLWPLSLPVAPTLP